MRTHINTIANGTLLSSTVAKIKRNKQSTPNQLKTICIGFYSNCLVEHDQISL